MSRLTLLGLATALLALPASALGGPTGARSQRAAAMTNAAFACRVLRDTHPFGFVRAFGGYRRCLSRGARPSGRHPPLTFTLHNLNLSTAGSVTAVDANPGCRLSD